MKKLYFSFLILLFSLAAQAQSALTVSLPGVVFCQGDNVAVSYSDAVTTYLPGNVFTVQLSDAAGSFANPVAIGQFTGTAASGTVQATIPAGQGLDYRIRVVSSNPAVTGNDNGVGIEIKQVPDVVILSNSPLCQGSALQLSASSGLTNVNYSWVGPAGFSASVQNPVLPNAQPANSGLYTVYADLGGCINTHTASITINPHYNQSTGINITTCEGDSLQLTTSASWPSGATYTWTGPGNYTSTLQNPVRPNALPSYSGNYTFTATLNGCTSAPSITPVHVYPAPAAPVVSTNSPVCEGETICFTTTAVGGGAFSWVSPSGLTFGIQNPCIINASPADNGVYTLFTVNSNGCRSLPAYVTIQVNPLPEVNATSNSPLCEGQTMVLNTTMVPGATYTWAGPSTADPFYSTVRNPSRSNIELSHAGTHHLTVTLDGCTAEDTVHVQVYPLPPGPSITSNATLNGICTGQTLILSAGGPVPGLYEWTTPNGTILNTNVISIPNVQLTDAGIYTCRIMVNGCWSSLSWPMDVTVKPSPIIQITASDTLINSGELVTLNANGANAGYHWSAVNPATAGLPLNPAIPQIQVSPTVTTTYMVIGANTNQCRDTAYVTVYVGPLSADEAMAAANKLQIFPNPNSGSFSIKLSDCQPGKADIKLLNMLGQELYTEAAGTKTESMEHQLNMQDLPAGMYMLQVTQGEKVFTKRMQLQR